MYGMHCRGISQIHLHTHVFIHEWNEPYLPLPFQPKSWSSFIDPGEMEGCVGLGTTKVSKQFFQDRYVTAITVVSCSVRHISLGNWRTVSIELMRPLGSQAATLTTAPPSHPCYVLSGS